MELSSVAPEPEYHGGTPESLDDSLAGGIRWSQLRKLGSILFPTDSPYGKPTSFNGSKNYFVVGTWSADVLVFDHNQHLLMQLSARDVNPTMLGVVTSLSISDDESHIVVGFGLGAVGLWELESHELVALVLPSETGQQPGNGIQKFSQNDSHLKGVPIILCSILKLAGTKTFLSVDASGVVIRHKYRRVMLEYSTRSLRILGNPRKGYEILDCDISGNMIALLTRDILLIARVGSSSSEKLYTVVLKIPRSADLAADYAVTNACVCIHQNQKLIYSWDSHIKMLDLKTQSAVTAITSDIKVKTMEFLTSEFVVLLGSEGNLDVISLSGDSSNDIATNSMASSYKMFSSSILRARSIKVLFQSIFVLGEYEFSVGQMANWADQLLSLLNDGKPSEAVQLALRFWNSENNLSIMGLPEDQKDKQQIIAEAFPELLMTAMKFSLQFDPQSLDRLIPEAVNALLAINPDLLDPVAELIDTYARGVPLFYETLMQLVLKGEVSKVSPRVFKDLLTHHPDPEIMYKLDLSTLDINFAFNLCYRYETAFRDAKIFLETQVLGDYTSPMATDAVFDYLALALTSRIYPTGEICNDSSSDAAKSAIYNSLFFQEDPYYIKLVERNVPLFFSILNQAFEDPWLNENTVVSRQIIASFLIVHVELKNWHFASFLAQNYPKYPQFLALPNYVLANVLRTLCHPSGDEDTEQAQLSVLSLLSSNFKPDDNSALIDMLVEARYNLVLQHLLRRSRKFLELAQIELNLRDEDLWTTLISSLNQDKMATVLFMKRNIAVLLELDSTRLGKLSAQYRIETLWDDSTVNLSFLEGLYEEAQHIGGHVLPSTAVSSRFVKLLAQDSDPKKLIVVLQNLLTKPGDIELTMVVDTLLEYNRIDALTLLLVRLGRHSEALIYLRNHIRGSDLNHELLNEYVNLASEVVISADDCSDKQALSQSLLDTLSERNFNDHVLSVIKTISSSTKLSLPQVVQYVFREHSTTGIDLAPIVIVASSALASKLLLNKSISDIAQRDCITELMDLVKSRKEGWFVSIDGECEICGQKIAGLGVDANEIYRAWEKSMQNRSPVAGNTNRLLLYPCSHSYHSGCLWRMSTDGKCVICYP